RPEDAAAGAHAVAHAPPVRVRHEALERREAAEAEHHEVALLARADAKLRQRLRAAAFLGRALLIDEERAQPAGAVRCGEGHGERYATNAPRARAMKTLMRR